MSSITIIICTSICMLKIQISFKMGQIIYNDLTKWLWDRWGIIYNDLTKWSSLKG